MAPLVIFFFLPSSFKCLGFFQWSKEKKSGNLKKILQLGHPFFFGKKMSINARYMRYFINFTHF